MPPEMPRVYRKVRRTVAAEETRRRILATVRRLVPHDAELSVDRIAAEAGVSVQTIYTHFGSKGRLLMAVVDEVQRDAGLYAGFERVWASADGETALRRMVEATFALWHRAWPFVEFTVRARRSDPVVRDQLRFIDSMRHAHLRSIVDRIAEEGRLPGDRTAAEATDLAFALTTPTVYEDLVAVRGWSAEAATATVADLVVVATVRGDVPPVVEPPAVWPLAGPIPLEPGPRRRRQA